eukprot:1148120-Pelagomonas_calceolata.AAC.4
MSPKIQRMNPKNPGLQQSRPQDWGSPKRISGLTFHWVRTIQPNPEKELPEQHKFRIDPEIPKSFSRFAHCLCGLYSFGARTLNY